MPTTVTKSIGTAGGRDYSTLQSWEDAAPSNLVTSDQIWRGECYNDSEFSSGSRLITISGSTSDSTRYKELTCATGQSFSDNASVQTNALRYNSANGVALSCSSAYDQAFYVAENYARVSKIQLKSASGTTEPLYCSLTGGVFKDMIVENHTSRSGRCVYTNGGSAFYNMLVIDRSGGNTVIQALDGTTWINATVVTPSDKTVGFIAFRLDYNISSTFTNCAAFGFTNVFNSYGGTVTSTTNYTDMTSPPTGWTNTAYSTSSGAKFQGTTDAARDFRIQSGSSLIDVGTTNTNASPDIAGTTRPSGSSYDVGVWEYVAAGGTIYTITPSGGITFSGAASLRRTHVQPVSGSIAFSGSAALIRNRVQVPSGGIVFSGGVSLLRTRAQVPSGQITFSGTAPITFVPATGGTTYTITPSGGFTLSGAAPLLRTRAQIPSGGLSFSGAVPLLRTRAMIPSGNITFSGTVPLVRTRVQVPSGQIVFSGSAGIVFIPAGSVTAVSLNRISMGLDRANRVS